MSNNAAKIVSGVSVLLPIVLTATKFERWRYSSPTNTSDAFCAILTILSSVLGFIGLFAWDASVQIWLSVVFSFLIFVAELVATRTSYYRHKARASRRRQQSLLDEQ